MSRISALCGCRQPAMDPGVMAQRYQIVEIGLHYNEI